MSEERPELEKTQPMVIAKLVRSRQASSRAASVAAVDPATAAVVPIDRREALRRAGAIPLGLALSGGIVEEQPARAAGSTAETDARQAPRFFSAHEWATVRVLAELVIPADERSAGACEALVPEFIDDLLLEPRADPGERERLQTRVRGGLGWIDRECHDRHGRSFVECAEGERKALLDSIAWPARARQGLEAGAVFFDLFRDLVASGFWSSRVGLADLRYTASSGGEWKGCPPEVLSRLGLGDK